MKQLHLNCLMWVCPSPCKLIPRELEVYICWFHIHSGPYNITQLSNYDFRYSERACLHPRVSFNCGLIMVHRKNNQIFAICISLHKYIEECHAQINFVSRKSVQINKFLLQRWRTILLGLTGCCRVILGAFRGLLRVPWKIQRLISKNVTSRSHKH